MKSPLVSSFLSYPKISSPVLRDFDDHFTDTGPPGPWTGRNPTPTHPPPPSWCLGAYPVTLYILKFRRKRSYIKSLLLRLKS